MRYEVLDGQSVVNTIVAAPDFMAAHYPNGNYREAQLPEPAPFPKSLNRLEFETHAQTAAGMTDLEFFAALQDTNLALMWHRLSIAERVERDSDLTQNGLAAMVAAGHLTEEQVDAISQTWPTQPE
jgi:hypothetical protein